MVWGGISWEARTELVFIERGTLTAHRYIEEVLQDHVVGFAQFAGDGFIFMHDNARPHTARIVTDYLHDVGIDTMNWPARSPDLNPIEHLWDVVRNRLERDVVSWCLFKSFEEWCKKNGIIRLKKKFST
jgi:transposase